MPARVKGPTDHVVIVGAGYAGLSAALRLAGAGRKVTVIERCSGHGGTFGVLKDTHDVAMKIGKPTGRQVAKSEAETVCSDCPLAAKHLVQVVDNLDGVENVPEAAHPIEVFARAYQLI